MSAPREVSLETTDDTKVVVFLVAGFVAMLIPLVGTFLIGAELEPPLDGLAPFLGILAGVLANGVLLLVGRRRVIVRHHGIRFEGDAVVLTTADGRPVAGTRDGSLAIARVNTVRRRAGRERVVGALRLRAGATEAVVVREPEGEAWPDGATHAGGTRFTVDVGPFEALARAAR